MVLDPAKQALPSLGTFEKGPKMVVHPEDVQVPVLQTANVISAALIAMMRSGKSFPVGWMVSVMQSPT